MKQFNKEQAIAFAESKVWESWSDYDICRIQLFQDLLCIPFSRVHQAIEKELKRPVYTHEFAYGFSGLVEEFLGEKEPPTFDEIVNMIPKEKLIILGL